MNEYIATKTSQAPVSWFKTCGCLLVFAVLPACDSAGAPEMTRGEVLITIRDSEGQLLRQPEFDVHMNPYWAECANIEVSYPFWPAEPHDAQHPYVHGHEVRDEDDAVYEDYRFLIGGGTREDVVRCLVFAIGPWSTPNRPTFDPDTVFSESVELPVNFLESQEPEEVEVHVQL